MRWHRRYRTDVRRIVTLLVFPLLLTGVGYALYAQDLSISGMSKKPAYTATPNISVSYTSNTTLSAGVTTYNTTATVRNISAASISRWQVKFDLPSDFSSFSCGTSVTCAASGQTVTVNSGTGNSSITANGSTNFTFTFKSANSKYQLQNLFALGSGGTFQTISGLTVTATRTAGSALTTNNTYRFTVANGTGRTVKMWRIIGGPWTTSNNVTAMDSRVHWIDADNEVVIIDTDPLANGTDFVFSADMTGGLIWTLDTAVVTGVL